MTPAALTQRLREGVPLAGQWAVEVLSAANGLAMVRMPENILLLRPGGSVSGPALMGLADVAMWAALLTAQAGADTSRTTQLAIQFLRPIFYGAVIAEARVIRGGRRLLYGEVWLRAEAETRPAAHVTTQWAVVEATRAEVAPQP